jgi:hypothetical protein
MAGNSVVDRFRIFRRAIIVGACAIKARRRRSGAAIPIAGTAGARSGGSAAAAASSRTIGSMSSTLVAVLREVRLVLRPDGTIWLVIGDSVSRDAGRSSRRSVKAVIDGPPVGWLKADIIEQLQKRVSGPKTKDLVGIPWRVAFAQQDDGWWLRRDNV